MMILHQEPLYVLTVKGVDAQWVALTEEGVLNVFTQYIKDNTMWVADDVTEVLEVQEMIAFNNQVNVVYLCSECPTDGCEQGGQPHEDITYGVSIQHVNVYRDWNRNN